MKKTMRYIGLAAMALIATVLPSCSDDDDLGTEIAAPVKTSVNVEALVDSVYVEWSPVAQASQYGVVLYDADGDAVKAAMTRDTFISFNELTPSSNYAVKICSYDIYDGVIANEPETTVEFTTLDAERLDAPKNLKAASAKNGMRVTWGRVTNAVSYHYSIMSEATGETVSGDVTTAQAVVPNLGKGTYRIAVNALSGDAKYLDSEDAVITFDYSPSMVWNAKGKMTDPSSGNSWNATIQNYGNENYVIVNWYGTSGYNLEFHANEDGSITLQNAYVDEAGVTCIKTSEDGYFAIDLSKSTFKGNNEEGYLYLYNLDTNSCASFVW